MWCSFLDFASNKSSEFFCKTSLLPHPLFLEPYISPLDSNRSSNKNQKKRAPFLPYETGELSKEML